MCLCYNFAYKFVRIFIDANCFVLSHKDSFCPTIIDVFIFQKVVQNCGRRPQIVANPTLKESEEDKDAYRR